MPFGRREPIKCIETDEIFNTKSEAAKHLEISVGSVQDSLRDGKSHRGYTFVYVADLDKYTPVNIDEIKPGGNWQPISGFEGLYEINPKGEVWSIGHWIVRHDGKPQYVKSQLLTPSSDVYPTVTLTKDKKPYAFSLARLVATTYIPNPSGYKYVNHKDGNPKNNCADNLEWVKIYIPYSHPKRTHVHNNSPVSSAQLLEIQHLLGDRYIDSGEWRLASVDSSLSYAICSSGKYLIQLSSPNRRNANMPPRIIKFALTADGYLRCSFGLLHRIVAEAFLPDWDENLTVNHIDGDKLNNDISNLEMLPNAENVKHYFTSPVFEDSRNVRMSSIKTKLTGRPGKPMSDETREKLKQAALGHVLSEEQKYKLSQSRKQWWKIHGESFSANHPQNGKRYITNGSICKLVTAEEAESYVQQGWIYGMKPRGN